MEQLRGVFVLDNPGFESSLTDDEGEVIKLALAAGKKNIAAVIGSITQPSIYTATEHELSPDLATALGYLQILLVDFSDNLSERFIGSEADNQETVERRFRQGMGLYRGLAALVSPTDFPDNFQDADSHFKLSEELSKKLYDITGTFGNAINSIFGSNENSLLARRLLAQTIMNYGACVEQMHIPNVRERERLYHHLVENKADYASKMGIDFSSLPDWLKANPHGYMYFGSPMLAYAVIGATATDKFRNSGDLEILQIYYQLVPFLHVFLDGVTDDLPDAVSGNTAPNLARLVAAGEVTAFAEAPLEDDPQKRTEAFVTYLLSGIQEMKGTTHIQVIKDLVKFYQLELARNSVNSDNKYARGLLGYIAEELASI